jgi:hypothetical protein
MTLTGHEKYCDTCVHRVERERIYDSVLYECNNKDAVPVVKEHYLNNNNPNCPFRKEKPIQGAQDND